jgi:sugar lactone lactonase YvrE
LQIAIVCANNKLVKSNLFSAQNMITKYIKSFSKISFCFFVLTFVLLIGLSNSQKINANYYSNTNIPSDYQYYGTPGDMVVEPNGDIWYADTALWKVQKVSATGELLRSIGKGGSSLVESEWGGMVTGMTQDNQGNLYALEGWVNCQITKLDSNGGFIARWGTCGNGPTDLSEPKSIRYSNFNGRLYVTNSIAKKVVMYSTNGQFLGSFGSVGLEDGQFTSPFGLAIDSVGNVYVGDRFGDRVQVFDQNGNFLYKFSDTYTAAIADIEVLGNGEIVVSSVNTNRVSLYSNSGTFIRFITTYGRNADQIVSPAYLTSDSSNNIYVGDNVLNAIKKFDINGGFISNISNSGTTPGRLNNPSTVSFDPTGDLYVYDSTSLGTRLQKFTAGGNYVSTIKEGDFGGGATLAVYHNNLIYVTNSCGFQVFDLSGILVQSYGNGCGSGDGQFNEARGMAFDSAGNLYIADMQNARIQVYNSSNEYVAQFGSYGSGDGEFIQPQLLTIDGDDNIIVSDNGNHRVQVFYSDRTFKLKFGTFGQALGDLYYPGSVAVDSTNNIYVADLYRISKFTPTGTFIEQVGGKGNDSQIYAAYPGVAINTASDQIIAIDPSFHRLALLSTGSRIYNLIQSVDVLRESDQTSLVKQTFNPADPGSTDIPSQLTFGDYLVSDVTVDLTQDRDWSNVDATSLPSASKALLVNLNPVDAPGVSATHSLYVVKGASQTSVYVCPNAGNLGDITSSCAGGYELQYGGLNAAANLSLINVNGVDYWKIDGLTGTGALGISVTVPSERLVLTPNKSSINATQEVVLSYTPSLGFISSDIIQFHFESTAGFIIADNCAIPTTDANGDTVVDGVANIIGTDVYQYTFSDTVLPSSLSFCVNVTSPAAAGSYSVRLTDDNGNFDTALFYVGGDNEVFVIANVSPSLSFNIRTLDDSADTNICSFGTVSPADPIPNYDTIDDGASECGYSLAIGTNAQGGFEVQVQGSTELSTGLSNIAPIGVGGLFTAGVEKYGYANITTAMSGRNPYLGTFTQSVNRYPIFQIASNATPIPVGAPTSFLSYNDGIEYSANTRLDDVTKIMHGLVVGSGTAAGYYQQEITYTVTPNF